MATQGYFVPQVYPWESFYLKEGDTPLKREFSAAY
jgi:hypothetical protein